MNPTAAFYGASTESEAERLRTMAQIADAVSIEQIDRCSALLSLGQPVIFDIGSGESTSLGELLQSSGSTYLPFDARKEAVEAQRRAGFTAAHALATCLDASARSADIVHARFTWGWLTHEERDAALAEALRVGKSGMACVVIDYDWSVVTGPEPFVRAVQRVKDVMRRFGFEPDYGADLESDLDLKIRQMTDLGDQHHAEPPVRLWAERYQSFEGTISGALGLMQHTVDAIVEQLRSIGMHEDATAIADEFSQLKAFVESSPELRVTLPHVVAVSVVVRDKEKILSDWAKRYHRKRGPMRLEEAANGKPAFFEDIDYRVPVKGLPELQDVVIALSPALRTKARQLQAAAYLKDRIVSSDAIGDDGLLLRGIDPDSLVARSKYFVTIGGGSVTSCVRMILPDSDVGLTSLPTFGRLARHSPDTFAALASHPVTREEVKVLEVSAFAKDPMHGSLLDVIRSVLVLAEVAYREGFSWGIMGLQESRVGLMKGVFGPETLLQIGGEDAIHPIDLPGVRESMRFVPLLVCGQSFLSQVRLHAEGQGLASRNGSGGFFRQLLELTEAMLAAGYV